jgi:hypothetical protein
MDVRTWLRAHWDRVSGVACVAGGLLALLLGWLGLSDVTLPAAQIPYLLSGGFLGLVLVGIGATLWMSADMRDEWRKLDRIEEIGRQLLMNEPAPGVAAAQDLELDVPRRNSRARLTARAGRS